MPKPKLRFTYTKLGYRTYRIYDAEYSATRAYCDVVGGLGVAGTIVKALNKLDPGHEVPDVPQKQIQGDGEA